MSTAIITMQMDSPISNPKMQNLHRPKEVSTLMMVIVTMMSFNLTMTMLMMGKISSTIHGRLEIWKGYLKIWKLYQHILWERH